MALGGGGFGSFESGVDTNGILNDSGSIYGRAVVLFRELGSFTDHVDSSPRVFVAPSLTIELGADTRITFLGHYLWEKPHLAFPLPPVGTVLPNPNGKISRFFDNGEPVSRTSRITGARNSATQLEHRFSDVFSCGRMFVPVINRF